MSSKKSSKQTSAAAASPAPSTPATHAAEPKKRASRKAKEEVAASPAPAVPVASTPAVEPIAEEQAKRKRVVTKNSVSDDFSAVIKRVSDEIERLSSSDKTRGVKFLKSLNKSLKVLQNDTLKVMKVKKSSSKKNVTSGFLKPINISAEMATFTGWDPKQLYSRVSVTQHICEYIKKNHLFNPEDKRQIKCDAKLKSLLRYDAASASEPLTYFRLQQYLKPHFIKTQ
jgi:chromatin remodeling complex protein RSC6